MSSPAARRACRAAGVMAGSIRQKYPARLPCAAFPAVPTMLLVDFTALPTDIVAAVRATAPLEVAGVVTGIICVWLAARSNIWNFPVAIVSCGLYLVIFLRNRLYSDAGLQLAFIALAVYGWWAWLRRQAAAPEATPGPHPEAPAPTTLPITRTSGRLWAALLSAGLVYALGAGYLFTRYTDAALPYYDSATTAVSLVAQYQLSRRKLENWALWIGVDVVYVGIYWHRGLALTSLLYAVYLGLAAYGGWEWLRESKTQKIGR
ncbi:MAG: nicotinamide riboside transporter PnuC [Hymenobacter sp.]|nr:MAG: nicotinamide riboside transporter PnuC [Hymenobacter sp.]